MAQKRQLYDFLLLGRRIKNKNVWGKREKRIVTEREREGLLFLFFWGHNHLLYVTTTTNGYMIQSCYRDS